MAIDLTLLSPQQLDQFIHLQSIVFRQKETQERIKALRDYYDGEHPVLLSDRQEEYIGKALTDGEFAFAHNTVKSIVDTLRERLSVSGFTVNDAGLGGNKDGENTPASQVAALMWAWWEENRLDAQQIRLHRRALRDGASYVMVDYDQENQRPRFTLLSADDGTHGVVCHRDPENPDIVLMMNNYWYTVNLLEPGKTGIERKTTYLPGQVRKYILGKEGKWARMDGLEAPLEPGDTTWPLPWVDGNGKPLGITIKQFENPGGSEVAQIIGLQNILNKTWLDLMAAADAAGFPIMVIENELLNGMPNDANIGDDDDIEGDDEFVIAPGRMLSVDGARVHRIEGSDLSQLINTVHLIVETIAGISRTPSYYLRPVGGSDVPSGEALKQLESGLVTRAIERQLIFGQAWADVMEMAYKVAQTFGAAIPDVPKLKVQTVWASAETRHEQTDAATGEAWQRLKVPDETIWQMLGFSPEQIARWKATQRSDTAMAVATIGQALQRTNGATLTAAPARANGTGDAAPENIESTEGLNGIQIRAAVELLEKVSRKEIPPNNALELLITLGIGRDKAQAMVDNATGFVLAAKPPPNGAQA